jgi:Ca2+/H+ antiporter
MIAMVPASLYIEKSTDSLAFSVRAGSSVQQALFVAPVLVLLSLVAGKAPMDLAFKPPPTVSGQSHRMIGVQLLALFGILTTVIVVLT